MSTSEPICAFATAWRKGEFLARTLCLRLSQLTLLVAVIACGCRQYEYEPAPEVLQFSGEINSSELGELFLRYGRQHDDPLAIMSAVQILARSRDQDRAPKDELERLLDQALELNPNPDDEVLDSVAASVREALDGVATVSGAKHWKVDATLNDAVLADLVWQYGETERDPLAVIASILVMARLPAGENSPTADQLLDRLNTVPATENTIWPELADNAALKIASRRNKLRGDDGPHVNDWPGFLGPGRDGKAGPIDDGQWQDLRMEIKWQKGVGTGYAMCSIQSDQLFQFDRHGDFMRLSCWDAQDGSQLWSRPFEYKTNFVDLRGYNGGPRCSPVINGDRVYIYGPAGKLHCVNANTGELVWGPLDTATKYNVVQNQFGVGSTPLVVDDKLIVVVGGSDAEFQDYPPGRLNEVKGNGSAIVALDKMTGEEIYAIGTDLASYASPQTANINGEQWCFAFLRAGLIGFDPQQGKIRFEHPWSSPDPLSVNASTPVIDVEPNANDAEHDEANEHGAREDGVKQEGRVFISTAYGQGSLLLKVMSDGRVEPVTGYNRQGLSMQFSTPILHEGYLYGSSGEKTRDAELCCIDWNTGERMWSEKGLDRMSLLYVDRHFVGLSEYGKLILFKADHKNFELVSQFTRFEGGDSTLPPGFSPPRLLKYPCWTAPALANGLLYILSSDSLVCLELTPQRM